MEILRKTPKKLPIYNVNKRTPHCKRFYNFSVISRDFSFNVFRIKSFEKLIASVQISVTQLDHYIFVIHFNNVFGIALASSLPILFLKIARL